MTKQRVLSTLSPNKLLSTKLNRAPNPQNPLPQPVTPTQVKAKRKTVTMTRTKKATEVTALARLQPNKKLLPKKLPLRRNTPRKRAKLRKPKLQLIKLPRLLLR